MNPCNTPNTKLPPLSLALLGSVCCGLGLSLPPAAARPGHSTACCALQPTSRAWSANYTHMVQAAKQRPN